MRPGRKPKNRVKLSGFALDRDNADQVEAIHRETRLSYADIVNLVLREGLKTWGIGVRK